MAPYDDKVLGSLAQVMARCLPAPSWTNINLSSAWSCFIHLKTHSTANGHELNDHNAFENVSFKIKATSHRGEWVNHNRTQQSIMNPTSMCLSREMFYSNISECLPRFFFSLRGRKVTDKIFWPSNAEIMLGWSWNSQQTPDKATQLVPWTCLNRVNKGR